MMMKKTTTPLIIITTKRKWTINPVVYLELFWPVPTSVAEVRPWFVDDGRNDQPEWAVFSEFYDQINGGSGRRAGTKQPNDVRVVNFLEELIFGK